MVHFIVNQHDRMLGFSYQIGHETVSIKYLPIVKYTLYGWNICIQSLENLINAFVRQLLMPFHFKLMIFYRLKPFVTTKRRMDTKARIIRIFTSTAVRDFKTELSMAIPCSVKA